MKLLRRQDGIASLVGVSLTAFLILVITISTATFMSGELQKSTDNSDSVKAYFNAQSAAEETIWDIRSALNSPGASGKTLAQLINQGCNNDEFASTGAMGYGYSQTIPGVTCRQVQATTSEAVDSLSNNQVVQYDLTNSPTTSTGNISELDLQWDMKNPPRPPATTSFTSPTTANLSDSEKNWGATTPPVIELTVTNYFPGQPTTVDQTTNGCAYGVSAGTCSTGTVLLVPQWQSCPGGGCPAKINFQQAASSVSGQTPLVYSYCTNAGAQGYRCAMNLGNIAPAGYKTVVRMESRFADTSFDLKAYDNTTAQVQLPLQNALIDVTANVGTAFRRFQIAVPVRSGVYAGFDALYGDTSLCKDFDVLNDGTGPVARQTPGGCPLFDQYVAPSPPPPPPPDTIPPTAPTGLKSTGFTANSVSLSWNPSTDNVAVTGYTIYRNGVAVGTAPGTTFTDTGLTKFQTYAYYVVAFDAAGNVSPKSNGAQGFPH